MIRAADPLWDRWDLDVVETQKCESRYFTMEKLLRLFVLLPSGVGRSY